MPGTTPRLGWPTMLDTDPMANVAKAIRDLGAAVSGASEDLTLAAGWSGGPCQMRSSGGVVTVYVDAIKTTAWAASEALTSEAIPAAYRPTRSTYQAIMQRSTGAPIICYVTVDGLVRMALAGAGGAGVGPVGAITYNL